MTKSKMTYRRGQNLKLAREYRGYTQSQLAKQVTGLSQSNLSNFEKGFDTLSEALQEAIMDFLNWPVSFLSQPVHTPSR